MNHHYYCHFSYLEFIQQPERVESLFSQGTRSRFNSQNSLLVGKWYWNTWMTINTWGRYPFFCHTTQGRKTRALQCISWYHHRMCNIISEVSHKPTNRVQLYFWSIFLKPSFLRPCTTHMIALEDKSSIRNLNIPFIICYYCMKGCW